MKRFILPLLILLFVGSLFAVESAPSEVVGYVKYEAYTGYSYVAAPLGEATTALALGIDNQSYVSNIYKFVAATQGWESIEYDLDFEEWLGDFVVNPGDVLLFNCTGAGSFYSLGDVPAPATYNIVPGFNYITIPLNRSDLVSAQALGIEMSDITNIYKFNNQTSGWESIEYDMDFEEWLGDMPLSIGDVVLVRSTGSSVWPARSIGNQSNLSTRN